MTSLRKHTARELQKHIKPKSVATEKLQKDSKYTVANWSKISLFTDCDLCSQVHYLFKKAYVLQNQLKKERKNRMEGLKKAAARAELIRASEILIYQIK